MDHTVISLSTRTISPCFRTILCVTLRNFQIHLMELPNPDPVDGRPEHGGRDRHVAFTIADLQPLKGRLDEAGATYTMSKSGRAALFCRDLDGNAFEVIYEGAREKPVRILFLMASFVVGRVAGSRMGRPTLTLPTLPFFLFPPSPFVFEIVFFVFEVHRAGSVNKLLPPAL